MRPRFVSGFLFSPLTEFTANIVQELPVWCNYLCPCFPSEADRGWILWRGKQSRLWDGGVLPRCQKKPEHRVLTAAGADRGHGTQGT